MSRNRRSAIQGGVRGPNKVRSGGTEASSEIADIDLRPVPPPIPKLDPANLDWSDDESDWQVKEDPKVLLETAKKYQSKYTDADDADAIDPFEYKEVFYEQTMMTETNQSNVIHHYTHKQDHKRTILKGIHGDTKDKLTRGVKGVLPREERVPNYEGYEYPLPSLPAHVTQSLGPDIIEHLWYEFIMHGADHSELVKQTKLKKIAEKMERHVGYRLPEFRSLQFPGLDKNDYVEFTSVCDQLALIGEKRHVRIQKTMSASVDHSHPLMRLPMPSCCAIDSCQFVPGAGMNPRDLLPQTLEEEAAEKAKREVEEKARLRKEAAAEAKGDGEGKDGDDDDDDDDDDANVDLHALKVAYITHRLRLHGNLRLKHVPELLQHAQIPYDKSRYPSSEWELKGEVLVANMDECLVVCNMIRTDLDERVSSETDLRYRLPIWMEDEFKPSEIMLFKHHFKSIDTDGGGELDEEELQALTESLGSRVTREEATDMIAIMDLDGGGTVSFDEFMMLMYKIQNGVIDLGDNMLAKSMVAAKSQITVFEEIEENMRNPFPGCKVVHYGGTPVSCDFSITGPVGSSYEGGNFLLRITLNDGYPFKCPDVVFLTRIFHVNVLLQFDGCGYMQHLSTIWDSSWTIRKVAEHALHLLANPNIEYVPVDMIHIVKVFLAEKLAVAQEFERERREELQNAKDEREAEASYQQRKREEYEQFVKDEEEGSRRETRMMAGEDPIENAVEIGDMEGWDENMAAVLSMDEEDELTAHLESYRAMYAQQKEEQEAADAIAAAEKAMAEVMEQQRLDAEEQAEWDAGQDPTLALLEQLIGENENENDGQAICKKVDERTSDELMEPLMRQQQMHLATIQMFLFENTRYVDAVKGYVEKFAAVHSAEIAFEEEADDANSSIVTDTEMIELEDETKVAITVHHRRDEVGYEANEAAETECHMLAHSDDLHEEGGGPSLFYRNGCRKKNPNVDDESSQSEGEGELAGFD